VALAFVDVSGIALRSTACGTRPSLGASVNLVACGEDGPGPAGLAAAADAALGKALFVS